MMMPNDDGSVDDRPGGGVAVISGIQIARTRQRLAPSLENSQGRTSREVKSISAFSEVGGPPKNVKKVS